MAARFEDPTLSVKDGHRIAHSVEDEVHHSFHTPVAATIHVEPHS